MDKLIVGILGIILGGLITRILIHVELDKIKHKLFLSEEELDRLKDENAKLKKYNKLMSNTLKSIAGSKADLPNIPDFNEW